MKLKNNIRLLCAADGLSASGKSTGAKLINKKYGLKLLSSGLLYRYVSHKLLLNKKLKNKFVYLKKIANKITSQKLKSKKLFDPEVTAYAAEIAKSKKVRLILRKYQKNFAKQRLVIIEGRDSGTVICPNADIKFFFTCILSTKARRRLIDYRNIDKKITLKEVKKALKKRDFQDINRKYSPLKQSKDSIVIDTSKLNKKQMMHKISTVIEGKLLEKYGRNFKAK